MTPDNPVNRYFIILSLQLAQSIKIIARSKILITGITLSYILKGSISWQLFHRFIFPFARLIPELWAQYARNQFAVMETRLCSQGTVSQPNSIFLMRQYQSCYSIFHVPSMSVIVSVKIFPYLYFSCRFPLFIFSFPFFFRPIFDASSSFFPIQYYIYLYIGVVYSLYDILLQQKFSQDPLNPSDTEASRFFHFLFRPRKYFTEDPRIFKKYALPLIFCPR